MEKVLFVGLGSTGLPICKRIVETNPELNLWVYDKERKQRNNFTTFSRFRGLTNIKKIEKFPPENVKIKFNVIISCCETIGETETVISGFINSNNIQTDLWINVGHSSEFENDKKLANLLKKKESELLNIELIGELSDIQNRTATGILSGSKSHLGNAIVQELLNQILVPAKIVFLSEQSGSGKIVAWVHYLLAKKILNTLDVDKLLLKLGVKLESNLSDLQSLLQMRADKHQQKSYIDFGGIYFNGNLKNQFFDVNSFRFSSDWDATLFESMVLPLFEYLQKLSASERIKELLKLPLSSFPNLPTNFLNLFSSNIRLVVFDMAGTTVNEGSIVYSVLKASLTSRSIPFTEAEFDIWHGANKIEVLRHFIVTKNKGTEETVNEAYNEFQNNLEKAYFSDNSPIQLFPGVIELFDLLRANGIVVTLNTGYPRKLANKLIEKLNVGSHIDGSIVSEEVGAGRPHPFMIQELMKRFNISDPSHVAKCGDTCRDMEEGRAAKCGLVIGVLSGADDAESLFQAGADVILDSVGNVTFHKTVASKL